METVQILNKVLPVILIITLGFIISRKNFISGDTIAQLRKIVLNISLPAVLFISFLDLKLEPSYLAVFIFMFLLCIVLFLAGFLIKKLFKISSSYFPYLLTGFEYGMLGISLFGTAYGITNIGPIAVIALGHEIFIWFLFLPLLLIKRDGRQKLSVTAKGFFSSPVIIAILASLLLNLIGARDLLYSLPVSGAIMEAGRILSYLTVPLILIIVGSGIKIDKKGLGKAVPVVIYRLVLLIPLALIINRFFIHDLLKLDKIYEIAMFSFLILPPPFIIPLFLKPDTDPQEKSYLNNVLTVHALVSIVIYLVYFMVNA